MNLKQLMEETASARTSDTLSAWGRDFSQTPKKWKPAPEKCSDCDRYRILGEECRPEACFRKGKI